MTRAEPVAVAINAGSSSVKVALFTLAAEPELLVRASLPAQAQGRSPVDARSRPVLDWIEENARGRDLRGAGHRFVHGGASHRSPERITPALRAALGELVLLAPNQLPEELELLDSIAAAHPGLAQIACFDTGFHSGMPAVARRLPLPQIYADAGVERYGFHGLSYEFLLQALARIAGEEAAAGRVIFAHLGSGSSLAAVRERQCVDTTMGFTPIGGVVMSSRSGDLDPGAMTFIARRDRLTADELEELLSCRSGLLGISGVSGDMRLLLERETDDPSCRLAVAAYVHSVRKAIGALTAVLGGLDTLVFSGGIGERSPAIRARICTGLDYLGVDLDEPANQANSPLISTAPSLPQEKARAVAVRVIATDEEQVIARAMAKLIGAPEKP